MSDALKIIVSALTVVLPSYGPAFGEVITPDLRKIQDADGWSGKTVAAKVVEDNDRIAVELNSEDQTNNVIWLEGFEFDEGTIEFDAKGKSGPPQSNFMGIAIRGEDDKYDTVYFRPFNFPPSAPRAMNAIQYASYPDQGWQELRKKFPGKFENSIGGGVDGDDWFHAQLEVKDRKVSVFVNNQKEPRLAVGELTSRKGGKIGLWWFRHGTIANLKIDGAKAVKTQPNVQRVESNSRKPSVDLSAFADAKLKTVPAKGGKVDLTDVAWKDVGVGRIDTTEVEGEKVFQLRTGQGTEDGMVALLPRSTMGDGEIEVDISSDIFSGIAFRAANVDNFDMIYFRPQNSGTAKHENTVQYVSKGKPDSTWRALRTKFPGKYEAGAEMKKNEWFHARIVLKGETVSAYVDDGKEPVLVVDKMLGKRPNGAIGLWGWNTRFRNFSFKPAAE